MNGFTGSYALSNWNNSTIAEGETAMTEVAGETPGAQFTYNVDLGRSGSGVTHRTAKFTVKVPASGKITFCYHFHIFHAWYQVFAVFNVFAFKRGRDQTQVFSFKNWGNTDEHTFQGTMSVDVLEGGKFGFEIGGANYDSTSVIRGTLTITEFNAPEKKPARSRKRKSE